MTSLAVAAAVVAGALLLTLLLPALRQRVLSLLLRATDSKHSRCTTAAFTTSPSRAATEDAPGGKAAAAGGGGGGKGNSSGKNALRPGAARHRGVAGGGGAAAASAAASASTHALKIESLKGISKFCTAAAVAPNGRVAAAASSDATVHLFDLGGGFAEQQQQPRPHIVSSIQGGDSFTAVDFVYGATGDATTGTGVAAAPPLVRIAGALENVQRLVILELRKPDTGKRKSLCEIYRGEVPLQKNRVTSLIASRGPWIFTASEEDDTEIHVWSLGGELLASVDTKQVLVHGFGCSPVNGRFCAVAAWAPGVKIYEVNRDNKKGAFGKLVKAMDLKSRQGTRCVAISFDNRRAVTVEKQAAGKASLWNIDVRYLVAEEPRLLGVISLAADATAAAAGEKHAPKQAPQQQRDGGEGRHRGAAAAAAPEPDAAGCYGRNAATAPPAAGATAPAAAAAAAEEVDEEAFRRHVSLLSFSADGKFLICAADRHLRFIRLKQQEGEFGERPENAFSHASIAATIPFAHQHPIHTLVVPQHGEFIFTASLDSRPQLWRLPSYS